jgi:hypothetical protein
MGNERLSYNAKDRLGLLTQEQVVNRSLHEMIDSGLIYSWTGMGIRSVISKAMIQHHEGGEYIPVIVVESHEHRMDIEKDHPQGKAIVISARNRKTDKTIQSKTMKAMLERRIRDYEMRNSG